LSKTPLCRRPAVCPAAGRRASRNPGRKTGFDGGTNLFQNPVSAIFRFDAAAFGRTGRKSGFSPKSTIAFSKADILKKLRQYEPPETSVFGGGILLNQTKASGFWPELL
jgi:hypothetical protein